MFVQPQEFHQCNSNGYSTKLLESGFIIVSEEVESTKPFLHCISNRTCDKIKYLHFLREAR